MGLVLGGYEILSGRDGAAAIAMAASERPDLILMDLNLPEIDGWEATRRLKAAPATYCAGNQGHAAVFPGRDR
jgi:CheY-like chemotaxis protein